MGYDELLLIGNRGKKGRSYNCIRSTSSSSTDNVIERRNLWKSQLCCVVYIFI
jgi:hypothetical protein